MGNLLAYDECFLWEDRSIDRGESIEMLLDAWDHASQFGDKLFHSSFFYSRECSWGNLFLVLFELQYETELRREYFPWLKSSHLMSLVAFAGSLSKTSRPSDTLEDLESEFAPHNNGLIGLKLNDAPKPYVHDVSTWQHFHGEFVLDKVQVRYNDYEYFNNFRQYGTPKLKKPVAEIRKLISTGKKHSSIKDIHDPPLIKGRPAHDQQVHVHFTNKTALNINGTWKHENPNAPRIAAQACKELEEWGFLLPAEYYQ